MERKEAIKKLDGIADGYKKIQDGKVSMVMKRYLYEGVILFVAGLFVPLIIKGFMGTLLIYPFWGFSFIRIKIALSIYIQRLQIMSRYENEFQKVLDESGIEVKL